METTKHIFAKETLNSGLMEVVHSTLSLETLNQSTDEMSHRVKLSKKEQTGLKIIYSHKGKRKAFEFYRRHHPEMAMMYLKFVSEHSWVQYITWDDIHKRFVT